jgi:hypothetical protein
MNALTGLTAARPRRLRRRTPYPIAELPPALASSGKALLLLCGPEQGGWRLGSWRQGAWRDANCEDERLEPSHFALASGWRQENGHWRHAGPSWKLALGVSGGVALAWILVQTIAPEVGRDLWALCTGAVESGSLSQPAPGR